jgi:tetratricopeptide (TPR) repeat protein
MKRPIAAGAALIAICAALTSAAVLAAAGQTVDRLAEAKGLYESAEYDRALAALERIDTIAITPDQRRDRVLYQALCLLALEKEADAESKIGEMVRADPLFSPGRETPPRLRDLVDEVRARMRPELAQQHYRTGKEHFDREEYARALEEFTLVIRLADSDDANGGASQLEDLKLLASGFRDLARSALEPKPVPTAGVSPGPAPVVPPVAIREDLPAWPTALASRVAPPISGRISGVLDIIIGPDGRVDSVNFVDRIHPVYDALLFSAVRRWRYEPATRGGQAISYLKRLTVNVVAK